MNNKYALTVLSVASFLVGVAIGATLLKTLVLSSDRIEAMAEKRALEKFDAFVKASEKRSALFRDSLTRQEREKLIFEYKRIISSDDTEISRRVDAILDSMYSAGK